MKNTGKLRLIITLVLFLASLPAHSVSAGNAEAIGPAAALLNGELSGQSPPERMQSSYATGDNPEDEDIRVLSSTAEGITFEVTVPWEELIFETLLLEGREYTVVTLDDWPLTSVAGAPVLPVLTEQIGAPFDAELTLSVWPGAVHTLNLDHPILPKETQIVNFTLPTDDLSLELPEPIFVVEENPVIYGNSNPYPADLVQVTSDGILRQQRIIGLSIQPVQYLPTTNELIVYETFVIEINFGSTAKSTLEQKSSESSAYEEVLEGELLNYEEAEEMRLTSEEGLLPMMKTFSEGIALPYAPPDPGWRIKVREDGIYRLTYDELLNAGFLDTNPDPHTFQLFNFGNEVALQVIGEGDGSFDDGDIILFFGQAHATKYSSENVYWLTYDPVGAVQGARMQTLNALPGSADIPVEYTNQLLVDDNTNAIYISNAPQDKTEEGFFWQTAIYSLIAAYQSWTNTFSLPSIGTGPATIKVSLYGYLEVNAHHLKLFVNDIELADETWDGIGRHTLQAAIPDGVLHAGDNVIKLQWVDDINNPDDIELTYIDWYELEYPALIQALNNGLTFTNTEFGTWDYVVDGFTTDQLMIFDLSNTLTPAILTGTIVQPDPLVVSYTAMFQDVNESSSTYWIGSQAQFKPVHAIEQDNPSNLRDTENGADYLVISHANFMTQAQQLADYRAGNLPGQTPPQVLRSMATDVQDIYDEFGYGIPGAEPIREFLEYTYTTWQGLPAPSHVVLMGDGHYDPKNYINNRISYIPPFLAPVDPWIGETSADNLYVTLSGEDNIPDMMLGRLPVNTAAEAAVMVNKIINYEQNPPPGNWQQQVLTVADNADGAGDFAYYSESLHSCCLPAPYTPEKIFFGITYSDKVAAQTAIINSINSGKLLVNYNGHGGVTFWASEQLLSTSSLSYLNNGGLLPVMVSMACQDGYYINNSPTYPNKESLSEMMVRAEGKGALASWAATGLGVASGHDHLNRGFYNALFRDGAVTLGNATTAGKLNLYTTGANLDLLDTYLLFGDPAQVIPITQPLSVSGQVVDDLGNPIANVAVYDNTGHFALSDTDGYYAITGTPVGDFTLTPYKPGYAFTPETHTGTLIDSDITGMDFTGTLVPVFTISGYARDSYNNPIVGVLITDDKGHSTYTNDQGYYEISELFLGSQTLAAAKDHHLISPLQQTVEIIDSDLLLVNFVTDPLYTLSGTITDGSGNPVPDVTVDNGLGLTTQTDAAGTFTFPDLVAGSYNVIPSRIGYVFDPASTGVEIRTNDVTGINFSAALDPIFSISGAITAGAVPVAGVTISDGAGHSAVSDDTGAYSITGLTLGSYTLTPEKADYIFDPVTQSPVIVDADLTGIDFSAIPVYTISGTVRDAFDVPVPGVTITDNLVGATDVTDAAGTYTLTTLPANTYTLTADKTGDTFFSALPGLNIVTVGPSATGIDFIMNNRVPTVTTSSPAYAGVDDEPFTLIIIGQDFVQGAVARWNGVDRTTTYVDSQHLSIDITEADLGSASVNTITVFNPAPGGGESASSVSFPVIAHTPVVGEFMLTNKVTFDWDDLAGATLYNIQMSLSSTFSGVVFNGNSPTSGYTYGGTLLNARTYYWRIRPQVNGSWGDWSQTWVFTSLIQNQPAISAVTSDTTPTFSWFGVPGAIGYTLEVIPEDIPDNPATSSLSVSLPTVTGYTIPNVSTLDHGRYLWRLQVFTASSALTTPWRPLSILPPAPLLLSPANNTFTTIRTPELSWEPVPGVTGYQLIVDNNSDFRTPEYPEVTLPAADSAHTLLSSLPSDTRYYWRMRSTNLVGDGPWSPTYSFIVDTGFPAVPRLNGPADAAFTPDTTPSLSVFAAAGANRYNFQLSASSDFSAPLFDQTITSTTFTVPNADALPYAEGYFWRARSLDAAGNASDWSDPRSFTVTFQNAPAYNTATSDTTPTFTWYGVPGAYGYLLEVIPELVPDNPATSSLSVSLPTVTNYTVPNVSALDHGRYLWRLQVFTASSALTTPWRPLSILPPAPLLLSPVNNTFTTTRTPELSWEPVPGVTGYQLIVDNNSDFRTPEYPVVTLPDTDSAHTLLSSLPSDTRYYWRMRSINLVGDGPWSPTYSFIVDTVFPAVPRLNSPTDTAFTPDTTPSLSVFAAAGANRYNFQLASSDDFLSPLFDQTITSTTFTIPNADALPYSWRYYWRARSLDAAGNASDWSEPRTFTLTFQSMPVFDAVTSDTTPTFTWYGVPGAYGYLLEIIPEDNPATPSLHIPLPVVTNYTLPNISALNHERYLWRLHVFTASSAQQTPYRRVSITPPSPALLSPANNTYVTTRTPELSWEPVPGVTGYKLIVDNNTDFRTPEYPEIYLPGSDTAHTLLSNLPADTRYYWRMSSVDAQENPGPWSGTRSFVVDTLAPPNPALYLPGNAASVLGTPTFSWRGSAGANAYQFQYAAASDFSTIDYSSGILASLSHRPPTMDPGIYYWRVLARDAAGNWSSGSTPRAITINLPVPAAPALAAPANNLYTNLTPTLSWNAVAYGNTYEVELSTSIYFTPASLLPLSDPDPSDLSFTPDILPEGRYYWHVRAVPGPWSGYRSFVIDTTAPPNPVLYLPANTSSVLGTPTFSWRGSAGANAYEFQYAAASDFSTIDYSSGILASLIHRPPTMDPGTYYWRVLARDAAGNWSSGSTPRTITINLPVPAAPALAAPANNLYTNLTPTLSWNAVAYGNTYEVELSTSIYFTPASLLLLSDPDPNDLSFTPDILPEGRYYWHVRAVTGSWSGYRSFVIDTTAQAVPRLNAPADTAFTADTTPSLSVVGVAGANRYNFQLAASSDFSSPLLDRTLFSTTFTVPNPDALPYAEGYFWRARSLDAAGNASDWSDPRSFTVTFQNAPAYNTATSDTTPTFTWFGVPGALGYRLEVIPDSTPGNPTTDTFSVSLPTVTGYTIPNISALDHGAYLWRIKAFTTSGTRESPWRPLRITAPAPTLLNPANNTFVNTSSPTLSWTPVPGVARYELWIDDSSYFNSLDYQIDTINGSDSTHTLLSNLPYDRRYFWRMRSIDFLGTAGPWSPTYSFIVDTVFPAVPRLNAPADNAFTADTTPSLSVVGVAGANRYNFQLAASSDFSSPLMDQTLFSTTFTVPNPDALPYAEGYFWRARSLDAAGNTSDWSDPRTFTITFQNAPAYNAATTDTTPTFTWFGVPGGFGYRLEVIPSPVSGNPTSDSYSIYLPAVTNYTIPNISDLDHGWYQWRIRVYTPTGTQYSPWRPLTVTPPPLAAPVLTSPVNVVINVRSPQFTWSGVTNAAGYEIMVDNSVYFNSAEYTANGIPGTDTSLIATQSLANGVYYWRMRTVNYLGVPGPWSAYRSFRITA